MNVIDVKKNELSGVVGASKANGKGGSYEGMLQKSLPCRPPDHQMKYAQSS